MGGCYRANLATPPAESAAAAVPPSGDDETQGAAAAFRRRRQARRAAFGMNKAVSCTGGIGDILKSLSSKDAPCTLATLHRLVHTFMIVLACVELLRAIIPQGKLQDLVRPLFTLIVASVTLANYSPKEFRRSGDNYVSRIVELVLVILYFVPALSKIILLAPEIPIVTDLAMGAVKLANAGVKGIRSLIAALPGGQGLSRVGESGFAAPRAQMGLQ